jgi:hypothetical protein
LKILRIGQSAATPVRIREILNIIINLKINEEGIIMDEKTKLFVKKVFELVGDEYTVLGKYIDNRTKIEMRHNICGFEYLISPNYFTREINGRRCSKCKGGVRKSLEYYLDKLEDTTFIFEEPELDKSKVNSSTNYHFRCKVCGNISFKTFTRTFQKDGGCAYCKGIAKGSIEEFKKRVFSLTGEEYSVLGKYVNNKTKIQMKHNLCGNIYEVQPKDFTKENGNRCPLCSKESNGEKLIKKYLKDKGLEYIQHFKDSNCMNHRTLEFDFKVLYNKTYFLIEFDGRLHFHPYKNNEKEMKHLENQQTNDKIKNDFCKTNNIKLLRIHYNDIKNISDILDNYIKSLKKN